MHYITKIISVVIFALLLLFTIPIKAKDSDKKEIAIEETWSHPTTSKERSLIPAIELEYFNLSNELSFSFYKNIGEINITVYAMNGNVLAVKSINTCFQNSDLLSLPAGSSKFIVLIEGEGYMGVGEML